MSADAFIRLYGMQTRKPGETPADARERARLELPTVAALAGDEPSREMLRLARAIWGNGVCNIEQSVGWASA